MTNVTEVPTRRRAALPLVAVAVFGLSLAVAGLTTARAAVMLVREAWPHRGESVLDARRRVFGAPYADGVERIRAALPRDADYLLASRGEASDAIWLRYDLAPRRARWLGLMRASRRAFEVDGRPHDPPPFVVVADPAAGPELVPSDVFFARVPSFDPGRQDLEIPCSVDVPAEGQAVNGELTLQGWCQERGGGLCGSVHVFLDGEERVPIVSERFPRPDVQAAIPEIGDASRAGWRLRYAFEPADAGERVANVYFLTPDGRFRKLVRRFRWAP